MYRPISLHRLLSLAALPIVVLSPRFAAEAKPAKVMIMRHGEKPEKGDDLTQKGQERAWALVPFFTCDSLYGKPDAIFAQEPTDEHRSRRPVQTVTPLANALKVDIKKFGHSDFAKMVRQIMTDSQYDGQMVLICWEHHAIPDVAAEFGIKNAPVWPDNIFDRLWIITFPDSKPQLKIAPEKLLYGDASQ
jgi:hypothetical protein